MAVDEAVLERYAGASRTIHPTLRLYAWNPPALSLGRSQPTARSCSRGFLRSEGIDLVRRPTGGLSALHEHERTYAVVGQLRRGPFPGGVVETYRRVAAALELALRRLGLDARAERKPRSWRAVAAGERLPACFDTASVHEISLNGRKLIGSAQLRRRGAFLQHGSILLRSDPARLARAVGTESGGAHFNDLQEALGRSPELQQLDRALAVAFEETFRTELRKGELIAGEAERAAQLRCWKYASASWTIDGRLGDRERRWGPGLEG